MKYTLILVSLLSVELLLACRPENDTATAQQTSTDEIIVVQKDENTIDVVENTPPVVHSVEQLENDSEPVFEDLRKEVPTEKESTSKIDKPTVKPEKEEKVTVQKEVVAPVISKRIPAKESINKVDTPLKKENQKKLEEPKAVIQQKALHIDFDQMLSKYVSNNGEVNYAGWKNDIGRLDAYLEDLSKNTPQSDWSKNKKLAYWINAYNAFTVKLILSNYPLTSITDLDGGKPWDKKWIKLGSKTYSLNNIENDIIRPTFKEPRIHFAVNCAAKSCPPLANKAFTQKNIESLLTARTKAFINNSKYNQLEEGTITISKIFEWYASDFGDVAAYISKYATKLIKTNAKIAYNEYDWALNKQ